MGSKRCVAFASAAQADFETALDTPIVALTANALAGDQERCIAAGFDEYLPKPFKQQQIEALLARWTRRSETSNAAAGPKQATAAATLAAVALPADEASVLDMSVIERIREMEQRGATRLLERLIETYTSTATKLMADAELALAHRDPVHGAACGAYAEVVECQRGRDAAVAALRGNRSTCARWKNAGSRARVACGACRVCARRSRAAGAVGR